MRQESDDYTLREQHEHACDASRAFRPERAARVACVFMLLPQCVVIGLLSHWQLQLSALIVSIVLVAQILCMKRLLSDPKGLAPWYNATGVTLYVLGMMSTAAGLGGWLT